MLVLAYHCSLLQDPPALALPPLPEPIVRPLDDTHPLNILFPPPSELLQIVIIILTGPLFCKVQFVESEVFSNDTTHLRILVQSHFPADIRFTRVHIQFNEPEYNYSIKDDTGFKDGRR